MFYTNMNLLDSNVSLASNELFVFQTTLTFEDIYEIFIFYWTLCPKFPASFWDIMLVQWLE